MEPIAVIGLSFRLPEGLRSTASLWKYVLEGSSAVPQWPQERLNGAAYHTAKGDGNETFTSCGANFLNEDVSLFDARFFKISTAEASAMDPQQRLLLETTYRACENAGISLEALSNSKTGVFTGTMSDDYRMMTSRDIESIPDYSATGIANSLLANRISWFFNLKGPSITVDTACSSSLTSIHLGCQSLLLRESSMAIVTGVNLMTAVEAHAFLSRLGVLSPDGHCYSFDDRANGYVRGEGVAVLVLKRFSDAISDGDTIRGVIRATGVNQDGYTPGITVPSSDSQIQLIQNTYKKAGLRLDTTRYVEAHGTGTSLGDPIEAAAIGQVFRPYRSALDPVYVGSVKANIGHLEGVSGIVGVIKTLLVLEHRMIPPIANFTKPNPRIDAEELCLKFPSVAIQWPDNVLGRASVNSFGLGGANAHIILDNVDDFLASSTKHCLRELSVNGKINNIATTAPVKTRAHVEYQSETWTTSAETSVVNYDELLYTGSKTRVRLLVWSAADEIATREMTKEFYKYIEAKQPSHSLHDDLAYTLSYRRSHLPWRSFAILEPSQVLHDTLQRAIPPVKVQKGRASEILFIFTGQGSQYSKMGLQLLEYTVFYNAIRSFMDVLGQLGCQWNILDVLSTEGQDSKIDSPEFSQPICTAIQIALVELLRSFNIHPAVVIGHSSGEIAAAYTTGAISLSSACRLAFFRGKFAAALVEAKCSGTMLAVGLSEHQIISYLKEKSNVDSDREPGITIACINSPSSITLSGSEARLSDLKDELEATGIFCRELTIGVGYHSPYMKAIEEQYFTAIQHLEPNDMQPTSVRMISTVSGIAFEDQNELRNPQYWIRNMVNPVQFSAAVLHLLSSQYEAAIHDIVEIGPHSTLQRPIKDILALGKHTKRYIPSLSRSDSNLYTILRLAGLLFCDGHPVRLGAVNNPNMSCNSGYKCLTDLPEYCFSRQPFWNENRLSKGLRFRPHPTHPLLGTPVTDWNPSEAKWRNSINVNRIHWLADHKVNGRILLPAAGMLAIVLEAVSQVSQQSHPIREFLVNDITFSNPIVISPDHQEQTHIETYLRQQLIHEGLKKKPSNFEVKIYVSDDHTWKRACSAEINVEYGDIGSCDTSAIDTDALKTRAEDLRRMCRQAVDTEPLYCQFSNMGLDYSSIFRGLQNVHWDENKSAVANIRRSLSDSEIYPSATERYVVHPATIDCLAQLSLAPFTYGGSKAAATSLPTRFRNLWISAKGLRQFSQHNLKACVTSSLRGLTGTDSSGIILNEDRDVLCSIEHLETTFITTYRDNAPGSVPRKLCYAPCSKPDITTLSNSQLQALVQTECVEDVAWLKFRMRLKLTVKWFISNTLSQLQSKDISDVQPHISRYIEWLKAQSLSLPDVLPCDSSDDSTLDVGALDPAQREHLLLSLQNESVMGHLFISVARNILPIIQGENNTLEILFSSSLVDNFYVEALRRQGRSLQGILRNYVDILAHKNPKLRVLEVGAGTGAVTSVVIPILQQEGKTESVNAARRFSQYDYTDISVAFFEKAREQFSSVVRSGALNFKLLDIERDPIDQGFDEKMYDLVVAGYVLHATKDLKRTLANVRRLLKPGGKLILCELTKNDPLGIAFVFGLLPGWWQATDSRDDNGFRRWGACISEQDWHDLLIETGFSGADAIVRDSDTEWCQDSSILFSTAIESVLPEDPGRSIPAPVVVCNVPSPFAKDIASNLNTDSTIVSLDDLPNLTNGSPLDLVFLLELENPFLSGIQEADFLRLKHAFLNSKSILWLMRGETQEQAMPHFHMICGLARVFRQENAHIRFTTLSVDDTKSSGHIGSALSTILEAITTDSITGSAETAYTLTEGVIHIQRIFELASLDNAIHQRTHFQEWTSNLGKVGPVTLRIGSPGMLDTLSFAKDDIHDTPLAFGEVEIEVQALGLNFRDLVVTLGKFEDDRLGCECAGYVSRVGPGCTLQPGDRVVAMNFGCMKTYARCQENLTIHLAPEHSFENAVALPIIATTAYYAIIEAGRLQPDETILVHSGAGGTGQMCIQIARMIGAKTIFATVSTAEKHNLLVDKYGLSPDHIFNSRDKSFLQRIKRATNGHGVNMVVNSLSSEGLMASLQAVAPFGRFIEIGKVDIRANTKLPMEIFANNVSFIPVAIDELSKHQPQLVRRMLLATLEMVSAGKLEPSYPVQCLPLSSVQDALRHMQRGKNFGKTVLTVQPTDSVRITGIKPGSSRFNSSASYVIAGGLGGLGRSAARWMASRGATNLILLSRSGPVSARARDLIKELNNIGVRVETPQCDIASAHSLKEALHQCAREMPPIKGCIQSTMVLEDALVENMSFSQWSHVIQSKVEASWNMHLILPGDLDFFVLLSSVSGSLGIIGQANYAAGNAFQDALAKYRTAHGERTIALDLAVINTVGRIAEQAELAAAQARRDFLSIEEGEFLALLDTYCNPDGFPDSSIGLGSPQVLIGVPTPEYFRNKGIDIPAYYSGLELSGLEQTHATLLSTKNLIEQKRDHAHSFRSAKTSVEAEAVVVSALLEKLSRALSVSSDDIDPSRSLQHNGVDSLVSVELRNWFKKEFASTLTVAEFVGSKSIEDVAKLVVDASKA